MVDFTFQVLFILIAIFFLTLSISKSNYQKLVENNGEKFANYVNRGLRVCGYLLLVCSIFWFLFKFI